MTTKELLRTKMFADFYESANNFCFHIENYSAQSSDDFLQTTRQKLLVLYDTALKFPNIDIENAGDTDDKLEEKEFEKILFFISERLDNRYYWHVFDPSNQVDTEPVCGDLLDDLGDIYKDLKRSISIFEMDTIESQETAVWQFKFYFEKHWGDHCINALMAMHFFSQQE